MSFSIVLQFLRTTRGEGHTRYPNPWQRYRTFFEHFERSLTHREEKSLRHVAMVVKFLDDNKPLKSPKSLFALCQTSPILLYFIKFGKSWRNFLWDRIYHYLSLKKESDNFCVLFTNSIKWAREIRKFHVVVVLTTPKKCTKLRDARVKLLLVNIHKYFLPLSLPSPSSLVLLTSRKNATMVTWRHTSPLYWRSLSTSKGVFTRENPHRREFHTDMTFWFRIAFTWWLGYFTSRYLKVHFMLIKCMYDSKSRTLRMRYPFQSTGRPISHRNGWSFRVYMIPLRDFVAEWNSRPGTRTGVTRASMKFVVVSCKQI